jgi:hypothetical protein
MHLLSALGIRHSVLHDDDDGRDYHKEINDLIHKCRNAEFTMDVQRISGDLERLLNIPPAGSVHRKPQHVMYLYDTNSIEAEGLRKLCEMVAKCTADLQKPLAGISQTISETTHDLANTEDVIAPIESLQGSANGETAEPSPACP